MQVTERIEEAINTVEGITELRSVSGAGISSCIAAFDLDRNIDVAAQDVRDRVARSSAALPARRCAAGRRQVQQRLVAGPDHRARRQPLGARADRDRRQGRQAAARTLGRRRRGARSSAAWSARSTSGWTPTAWRPTSCPISDGARRAGAAERRSAGRQRHRRGATSRCCARMGRVTDPRASTTWSITTVERRADPDPRHRPCRGRHQGAAHGWRGSTACRR